MQLIYKILHKIYNPRCVQANFNVALIRSMLGEWDLDEQEVCC